MTNNLIEQTNHSHHQPLLVKKNSSEVQSSQTLLGQMKKKRCVRLEHVGKERPHNSVKG